MLLCRMKWDQTVFLGRTLCWFGSLMWFSLSVSKIGSDVPWSAESMMNTLSMSLKRASTVIFGGSAIIFRCFAPLATSIASTSCLPREEVLNTALIAVVTGTPAATPVKQTILGRVDSVMLSMNGLCFKSSTDAAKS